MPLAFNLATGIRFAH